MSYLTLLQEAIARKHPVALLTLVAAPGRSELVGKHLLAGAEGVLADEVGEAGLVAALLPLVGDAVQTGRPFTREVAGLRAYVEPFLPVPELVVAGAGHVAQPIAQIAKLMGFAVTVIDDRAEYANRERFPDADRVLCEEFVPALQRLALGPNHYLVIVTRGHRHDMDCLREVIGRPLAYIGMIGSRNRVQTVFRLLEEEHGVDPAAFERVYSPIGLDLGARNPAEIGVAVAAELLKVRRGGSGESLSRLGRARNHGR